MPKRPRHTYTYWEDALSSARLRLNMQQRTEQWSTAARHLAGKVLTKNKDGKSTLVNEIGPAAREARIATYFNSPPIDVHSSRPNERELEEMLEALLDHAMQEGKITRVIRQVIQDDQICGRAFMKVSLGPMTRSPKPDQVFDPEDMRQQREQINAEMARWQQGDMSPVVLYNDWHWLHAAEHQTYYQSLPPHDPRRPAIAEHIQNHDLHDLDVDEPHIVFSRVSPTRMLYDPNASTWEDCAWVAEATVERLDDLRNDPTLRNTTNLRGTSARPTDMIDYTAATAAGEPFSDVAGIGDDSDAEWVVVWRVHDRRNKRLVVYAEGHPQKKLLLDVDWPYPCDIYYVLCTNDLNDQIGGYSDVDQALHVQEELNELRSLRRAHVRRLIAQKTLVRSDVADSKTLFSELNNVQGREYIPFKADTDMRESVYTIQAPAWPADAYQQEQTLVSSIRKIVGVGDNQMGIPSGAETATEASIIQNQFQSRMQDRKQRVAELLEDVLYATLQIYRTYAGTPVIVRLIGPEGMRWAQVDPRDIDKDLRVVIDVGAMGVSTQEIRRKQWIELLQVIQGNPNLDQRQVLIRTMREFGIRTPETLLQAAPPMPGPPPLGGAGPQLPPGPQAGGVAMPMQGQLAGQAIGV